MRVDVLDFCPHVNGMTTYAKHAAIGLRKLGVDCDVVSFTKSGKAPQAWTGDVAKHGGRVSHIKIDRCVRWADMPDYLDTVDGVVLGEPRNTIVDNAAKKDYDDPPYLSPLINSKKPWTCMIGCPQYDESYAPFLEELVQRSTCHGIIGAWPSFVPKCFRGKFVVPSNKYPYEPIRAVFAPIPRDEVVSVCGRLTGNKGGWTSLFARLNELPTDWKYHVHGTCGRGNGPSTVIQMIEALRAQYGSDWLHWLRGGDEWMPFRTDPFNMKLNSGHDIFYGGGFNAENHPLLGDVHRLQPQILLNLSSASFTMGTIEYIGLEALDAGCVLVTAPHLFAGDKYDVFCVYGHFENGKMKPTGFVAEQAGQLVSTLKDAMSVPEASRRGIAETNRNLLREWHDPAKHAVLLLHCLGLHEDGWAHDAQMTLGTDSNDWKRWVWSEKSWNPYMMEP